MSAQADRGGWIAIRPFVAGAVVLAVAMGIGRFAYTPAIVVMRRDAGLTVAFAGILASTNLAGYLLGALLAMHPFARTHRVAAVRIGTIAVVVTTAMIAFPSQPLWLVARFLTGVASGIVFVLTASLLLDRAAATGSRYGVATVFSGVGIGIAAAGILVPAFASLGGSRAAWLGTAAISALALAVALPMLPSGAAHAATTARPPARHGNGLFPRLALAYAVQGAAYIIPATFLVAMVSDTPALAPYAAATWVLVGIVAAPSMLWWGTIARRAGTPVALLGAYALQALTMLAPLVLPAAVGVAIIALGLGATFMAISALTTELARNLRPTNSNAAIGLLTVLYGIGQIIGPLIATHIALTTGSYRDALSLAAIALLLSAIPFALHVLHGRRIIADAP